MFGSIGKNRALQCALIVYAGVAAATASSAEVEERPNLLWLMIEDASPYVLPAYGNEAAVTPHLDRLAEEGMRYTRAWSTAPVCSAARTSLILGSPATSEGLDLHRHRWEVDLPPLFPQRLSRSGYYTTNNSKTDFNFASEAGDLWNHPEIFDRSDGDAGYNDPERKAGQPFFAVFTTAISHAGRIRSFHTQGRRDFAKEGLDPEALELPGHLPDLLELRSDYAFQLEAIQDVDTWVGVFLRDLERRGLAEDTIVFFFSDHGGLSPRAKNTPYETGLRVPLIVRVPPKWRHLWTGYEPGEATDRLVGFEDFGPTALRLARLEPPETMQGRAFAGVGGEPPRELLHGFRTNVREHFVPARMATDGRFKYIRYFRPHKPRALRNVYQFGIPGFLAEDAWDLERAGGTRDYAAVRRRHPGEELYDLSADPWETRDLSDDTAYEAVLDEMRGRVARRMRETRDLGLFPRASREAGGLSLRQRAERGEADWEAVLAAAELASEGEEANLPKLVELLGSENSALRFWGASGLATLGARGLGDESPRELLALLADPNNEVAAAAAEAAVLLGAGEAAMEPLVEQFLREFGIEHPQGFYPDQAAYSALETLTWYAAGREALEPHVPLLEELAPERWEARSLLVNLGRLPVAALPAEAQRRRGYETNAARRPLQHLP